MRNNYRFLTEVDRVVLDAIKESPKDSSEIRTFARERGYEIPRTEVHTRRLVRYGFIIRKTSGKKYNAIWEVLR